MRQALQIVDNHNMTLRTLGTRRRRQENYGSDWLWCLDGYDKLARYGIEKYGSTEVFTLNQRISSPSIERASTPHRRGISKVTPQAEREEEDRLTRPTLKPDLVGETGTQGADALAAADAVALTEVVALAQTGRDRGRGRDRDRPNPA